MKWPDTPVLLSWRGSPPSAFITQTSERPLRSDWKAMRFPSGEKKGPTLVAPPALSEVSVLLATFTTKMPGVPLREEKKAIRLASGDQLGWKSPPGPEVSWRAMPSLSEWIQMFISPPRSELKAISVPSGDQAPRLSSRVVLLSAPGAPLGQPLSGETGSR